MHFLQKYERYTSKNTNADSQIFNFSKMARIDFLTMPKRFTTPFLTLWNHIEKRLLKLELLSSDSFYSQGGSENFI